MLDDFHLTRDKSGLDLLAPIGAQSAARYAFNADWPAGPFPADFYAARQRSFDGNPVQREFAQDDPGPNCD